MAGCFVSKIPSSDRCIRAVRNVVHLPLQDQEITFDGRSVREDGREAATECAKAIETGDIVSGIIKQRVSVVLIDRVPYEVVVVVHFD